MNDLILWFKYPNIADVLENVFMINLFFFFSCFLRNISSAETSLM